MAQNIRTHVHETKNVCLYRFMKAICSTTRAIETRSFDICYFFFIRTTLATYVETCFTFHNAKTINEHLRCNDRSIDWFCRSIDRSLPIYTATNKLN